MKKTGLFVALLMLFIGSIAWAQESDKSVQINKSQDANSVTTGEIKLILNSDYCSIKVDGESWSDDTEFYNNGYTAVLYRIDRTQTHKLQLTPANPNLEPVEIEITPKMWKLVPYKHGLRVWRVTKKIKFKKKSSKKSKSRKGKK